MLDVVISRLEHQQRGRIALAFSAVLAIGLLLAYGHEMPESLRRGVKASVAIGLGVMLRDALVLAKLLAQRRA